MHLMKILVAPINDISAVIPARYCYQVSLREKKKNTTYNVYSLAPALYLYIQASMCACR